MSIISGAVQQQQRWLVVAASLSLAGLLLVLSGLSTAASLAGLAVAAPLSLLFAPVLIPVALLACLLATGAVVSGALALGSLSLLSRLAPAASKQDDDDVRVEQGKQRLRELPAVAGEKTPHAALAVMGKEGQSATDHKKPQNYEHYVAGRMVPNATGRI